jgi:hypothetical protein
MVVSMEHSAELGLHGDSGFCACSCGGSSHRLLGSEAVVFAAATGCTL